MSPPEEVSEAASATASADGRSRDGHRSLRRRLRRWLLNARHNSDLLDPYKDAARNLPSAACSALVLGLFCLSVVSLDWFQMRGGGCSRRRLPISSFLYGGLLMRRSHMAEASGRAVTSLVWQVANESYVDCVNADVIITVRTMLVLLLLGSLFTLMQLVFDLCAPRSRLLKVIQFNATGSITTSLVCATTCGLAYWATLLMSELQTLTRPRDAGRVDVAFAEGFYAVAGATLLSICSAFNCLRSPAHLRRLSRRRRSRGRTGVRGPGLSVNSGDLVMIGGVPQPLPPRYELAAPPAYEECVGPADEAGEISDMRPLLEV